MLIINGIFTSPVIVEAENVVDVDIPITLMLFEVHRFVCSTSCGNPLWNPVSLAVDALLDFLPLVNREGIWT